MKMCGTATLCTPWRGDGGVASTLGNSNKHFIDLIVGLLFGGADISSKNADKTFLT